MDRAVESLQKRAAADERVVTLSGGLPAPELMPRLPLGAAQGDGLQYGWVEGDERVRRWIAERLAARGAEVTPDDVIVTSGAQQALALAAAALLAPGDRVGVGAATYPGALAAFEQAGAIASQSDAGVAAHYVVAGVSNPEGIDEIARRPALRSSGAPIIVDEAYVELRFDGRVDPPLLADPALRPRVWHVGTVSKTLCPGLRIGWLVPPPGRRAELIDRKHAADLQAGSLSQAALAELLEELDYDAHLERARRAYRARADRLLDALHRDLPRGWRLVEPRGGFSVWVETDLALDGLTALARAVAAGVSFDPGHLFRPPDVDGPSALRLSHSYAPIDTIERGVARLVAALAR